MFQQAQYGAPSLGLSLPPLDYKGRNILSSSYSLLPCERRPSNPLQKTYSSTSHMEETIASSKSLNPVANEERKQTIASKIKNRIRPNGQIRRSMISYKKFPFPKAHFVGPDYLEKSQQKIAVPEDEPLVTMTGPSPKPKHPFILKRQVALGPETLESFKTKKRSTCSQGKIRLSELHPVLVKNLTYKQSLFEAVNH